MDGIEDEDTPDQPTIDSIDNSREGLVDEDGYWDFGGISSHIPNQPSDPNFKV